MTGWKATQHKGIRYREHPTRRHGRQPDRYFNVRFQAGGTCVNEGYGWASEGMSASKAFQLMAELKEELKTGKGSGRLADRQKKQELARQAELAQQEEERRRAVTYATYFSERYLVEQTKKESTLKPEKILHGKWIVPTLGQVPVAELDVRHVKKLVQVMGSAGKSARTIQYALAAVGMVIGHAAGNGCFHGPNPAALLTRQEKPRVDNRRLRFFSRDEAERLLSLLRERSRDVHDMTLLALHCGLRAGEAFGLEWCRVDLVHQHVVLSKTKSGKDRVVPMTGAVRAMLEERRKNGGDGLVFPNGKGSRRKSMDKAFDRAVAELGLNDGVVDSKNRLVFHSCRHTCASWMVQAGVPLICVKEMLGHSTIALTERYSHLAPDGLRAAVQAMEQAGELSLKVPGKQNDDHIF